MNLNSIIFEAKDTIAWITVNRPDTVNAANPDVWQDLEKPARALSAATTAIHVGLRDGLRSEQHASCMLFGTQDQTEGMAAFSEKRKPPCKGTWNGEGTLLSC